MRIAAFQFDISGEINKNYQKIENAILEAKDKKVDLIVFSECCLSGYPPRDIENSENISFAEIESCCNRLQQLVDRLKISVIIGTAYRECGQIFNRALVIRPDEEIRKYDKRALWGWDKDNFAQGNGQGVFELDFADETDCGNHASNLNNVKIGIRICYEIRFPEYFRELYREQTDVNIVLFCDVSDKDDIERYQMIRGHLQTRAVENVTATVSVNAISPFQTAPTAIFGKSGQVIAECERNVPGMCVFDFDKTTDNYGEKGRRSISDEMNQMSIRKLVKRCGLGNVTGEVTPVMGGLMHKMYRVQTTKGIYAVKLLNQEIMKRPQARKHFVLAEALERTLEKNDIPIVPALIFDGKKMVETDDCCFYVFRWQEGRTADWNAISMEQAYMAGELLGRIHVTADKSENAIPDEGKWSKAGDKQAGFHEISRIDFEKYLKMAHEKENIITSVLEDNIGLLIDAQKQLNEARMQLPSLRTICDGDMDPKNIMWHEGKPYIIDLECLDYGNPVESCLNLGLQWSGTVTENFSRDNFEAFFKGYWKAYDNGFRSYDKIYGIAYTWVEWLEYNIRRALGMEGPDDSQIKLGEEEVRNTIGRIRYLNSIEGDVRKILKQLSEKAMGRD